ncbi:hypothetical protein AQUCO_04900079v1 [Aquilegia coerulea]|uniref:F-box domain-containing protein n=1 Tax=Aquilegia coerulea TaxID=218851 RepID=A0A2G5CJR9_AQUCA|nr:hypothetical protein AQUCO_04900079v1 [Aquilegia coerulea]
MKKKNRMSNVVLPCEIIHENILTRLPIKSLLQFKCVCKSWYKLIRTPRFVKIHSDQCKNDPKFMLVYSTKDDGVNVYSLEYGENHLINVVKIPFFGFQFHRILGSCNGLVFVANMGMMYLWNPSTREYKLVPFSPQPTKSATSSTYGFGYNAITKDYEIIMISAFFSHQPYYSRYNIYSLRNNSWGGTFQDMSPYVETHDMGYLFNDALHWEGTRCQSIIAFDIADRNFREFPIAPTSEPRFLAITMASINGCFSIGIHFRFGVEIWMMKDYGVEESWTKMIKFSRPRPRPGSNPISSVLKCFAMNISTQNMDMPAACTLEELLSKLGGGNKKTEQLIAKSFSATMYTETLVQLQGHDEDDDDVGQFQLIC